jgi:periplasmic copper chaperone A
MSLFSNRPLHVASLAAAFAFAALSGAAAHEYKAGDLAIGHPWSRATPPGAKVAAGYLTVTNNGTEPDRLLSVASDISSKGEIHEMKVNAETNVMTMRPVDGGIEIKPGETVKLEPGGYHLMFVGLREPAVQGERFKGTLTFEKSGSVEIEYATEAVGGSPKGQSHEAHDHGAMDHSGHGAPAN